MAMELSEKLERLRGDPGLSPDASIVIPVNAQGDLKNVLNILSDIGEYAGSHSFEVILVINNYPPKATPPEVENYRKLGVKVVSIPDIRRPGEAIGFSARIPGVEVASSENAMLFDSDCRIPNSTALLDWYVEQFNAGAKLAYTHVGFYDFPNTGPGRARLLIHHGGRWIKRVLLRIPTNRGSNYAVNRSLFLKLYAQGFLADEMNVGPTFKSVGGRIAYSGSQDLVVLTSGRMITGRSWKSLMRYYLYRIRYNLRVLPVRSSAASYTKRENDPVRRFKGNKPVK